MSNDASIERTCRYGHGALDTHPEPWALQGAAVQPIGADKQLVMVGFNRQAYLLSIHRCPACGYTELSDYPPSAPTP